MTMLTDVTSSKPFLRWAGGKTWLVKHLTEILGNKIFSCYHEPFLGGGAIYFTAFSQQKSYLSDLNHELIDTYQAIKDNPFEVISTLQTYENTEDFYYTIRGQQPDNRFQKAARFIFLNQTSFNGIYRVNLRGEYNVPYGHRDKNFLEADKLIAASECLKNATLNSGDFTHNQDKIKNGDLVFLDPPYTVSHNNNGFIKYNQKLFSMDDQQRLSSFIDFIKKQGAYYILTNAAHQSILEIFEKGDKLIELNRASLIGGDKAKRGKVTEYIFTNIVKEEV
ncbi:DNA adenine methylase [Paenibacillus sp. NPDC056722]|uniref:DNA adenine methylase n=1 Tax=Paenibacillus sp. NPDC056722 TaxID=3345924 RepID=UPI0036C51F02